MENDPRLSIEILEYNELVADQGAYARKALDFFGANYTNKDLDEVLSKRSGKNAPHFRSGKKDEFKSFFTNEESAEMLSQLPEGLAKRFGWTV